MNKSVTLFKPRMWFAGLLVAALVAGCGGGDGIGDGTANPGAAAPGTVAPGASATDPTVGSASPSDSATNVATSTNGPGNVLTGTQLTTNFTEPMDPATIISPATTFTLKETTSGTDVPGTVAMNAVNTAATFTPASALTPNTGYTATVSTAAKNAGGTAMASPVAWSFTTNAAASTAQAPLDLGRAGIFAIFSNTAVTSTVPSDIQGNVGTAGTGSGTTIACSEVSAGGSIYTLDATYADATCNTIDVPFVGLASGDMALAITDAKTRVIPDYVDVGAAGNISGLVLAPGLYKWNTGVLIDLTGITISGGPDDVWIFQISGDLTVQNNAIITLAGGAQAKNIFWQTAGGTSASIGSAVQFKGIILADAGITLTSSATVVGRLLGASAITLITNTITPPAL